MHRKIDQASIQTPTLILNEEQAKKNLLRMADKASAQNIRFRPHFKTHQSEEIGEWFRDEGVSRMHALIEVSSPDDIHVLDLGSAKGTILNGESVKKAKLQDGSELLLGDTRVSVGIGQPVASEEAEPAGEAAPVAPAAAPSPAPQAWTPPQMGARPPLGGAPSPYGVPVPGA